ncbi:YfgM family protein [Nitrosomonas sp.]|uniref:YfgM family protein n=1 Tax=Nitrosomonas sp. TaxID=42353 RepID=UPI001D2A644D|nr:tetratricopeptide repeat protein [Nitrosomonas sp.]MBX3617469.1 tetratricopeptide repeat protein [Nitrosomonas sp.]
MATHHEDQERIEGLKAWWGQYGTIIIVVLTVAVATMGANKAWNYYQQQQSQQAADLYALLKQIQETEDAGKINDAAELLTAGYSSSGYASRAALIAALADTQAGNYPRAIKNLQWVIDHAKETELHDLARLRMSGILLDEEKYDEALRILNAGHSEAFAGLYLDRKGDIQAAAQKISEARLSYQASIDKLSKSNNYYNIVQMKLDALGESE